jgi:hypothetical protein
MALPFDANWEITGNYWQLDWVGISASWRANTPCRPSALARRCGLDTVFWASGSKPMRRRMTDPAVMPAPVE